MSIPLKRTFNSLPAYVGGKRKLLLWIFSLLATVIPVEYWSQIGFADAFVGGGSVSMFAKAQGFGELHCNDWSYRSQSILEGLIGNSNKLLTDLDTLRLFQPLPEGQLGLVTRELAGEVFSQRHAALLDTLFANIEQFACPTKRAMGKLLLWHVVHQCVAFGTSIGTSNRPFAKVLDGEANWWELNPKRLQDGSMAHLIQPVWPFAKRIQKRLNAGVFAAAGPVYTSRQDAFAFVSALDSQVLYLDPPYPGTAGYERENRVLDAVLMGEFPPEDRETSPFTKGTEALSELLVQARHIPVWVLSYGNKVTDLDTLTELVRKARRSHDVMGWAKNYQHLAHVAKNIGNQELLVISASRKFQESLVTK